MHASEVYSGLLREVNAGWGSNASVPGRHHK